MERLKNKTKSLLDAIISNSFAMCYTLVFRIRDNNGHWRLLPINFRGSSHNNLTEITINPTNFLFILKSIASPNQWDILDFLQHVALIPEKQPHFNLFFCQTLNMSYSIHFSTLFIVTCQYELHKKFKRDFLLKFYKECQNVER